MKMKKIVFLAIMIAFIQFPGGKAQAQTVEVSLEIPEGVVAEGDRVELRAISDGQNYTTATQLSEKENGVWIGSFERGSQPFEYKYVIVRPGGEEEWEGWWNRKFDPAHSPAGLTETLHHLGGEKLAADTRVMVRLDLSGFLTNRKAPEQVGVMGSYGELSWEVPDGVTLMNAIEDNLWEVTVTFPAGTQVDIPIKFVWERDGVWHWEQLPGFVDHLLILDGTAQRISASFAYNNETGRVEAGEGTGVLVDDYAEGAARYGGTRNYEYYRAMQLVTEGDYAGAAAEYEKFRSHFSEPYNDDFHAYLGHTLANNGQLDQALQIVDTNFQKEFDPYRKAHYRYLKGSLLLQGERYEASRTAMEEVLELAPEYNEEAIRGYALYGIGLSYLQQADSSQVSHAEAPLKELATGHPGEQMRRMGWEKLTQVGRHTQDTVLIEETMQQLTETGTRPQKVHSQLDWVEYRLQHKQADSALPEDLQWLEWTIEDSLMTDRVQWLKAEWLLQQGELSQAIEILEDLEMTGKEEELREKARKKLDHPRPTWRRAETSRPDDLIPADSTGRKP